MDIIVKSNPIFSEIHKSKKRYIAMKGSAGSGKSVDTAQQYILRLMKDKGRNLLCVRKSEVSNKNSTYSELVKAINTLKVGSFWKPMKNPLQIRCFNGNSIIFRGVNDKNQREKLKSIAFEQGDLTDVWIEEATEITQGDFEIIDDRLRGELPEGLFYQIKLTFNPVNINHWLKSSFFDLCDNNTLAHHSTYLDNRFIDKAYYERMERRKIIDPEGYQIYGLGNWGESGGLILSNWKVEEISLDFNDYTYISMGQDFGYNHANAILELGYKDNDLYILREIYEHEKDTSEIIKIADKMNISKLKDMFCDSAEPDRIKMWSKAGYRAMGVDKEAGCVNAQIDWLKQRRIHVHPLCLNTIKELGGWKWKMDKVTGLYLDEPVPFEDDAMAALRYGIEGWRKPSRWIY